MTVPQPGIFAQGTRTHHHLELDVRAGVEPADVARADLAAEQPCFVYHDSRDLTGFVDGTENPPIEDAQEVATLPEGQTGAGGAFVLSMRWRHDLAAFDRLPVAEQEAVIGRTKADSVELDPNPPTSHVSRVVIEEDGEELELWRRSTPWGTASEQGLYFLAFSADPSRFHRMLERGMFGATPDALHDALTDFSEPLSAAIYFAPSVESLSTLSSL